MSITVGIKNFRSYLTNPNDPENGVFKFRFEGGVNLLKGGSGAGKSTVLMAISWCLYKKPALGNTPLYKDSGRGETTVFFHVEDQIRVVRRSPGSLLTVQILDDPSEPTLENEEAQNYIYRRFGRETVWKTCNYVQQGSTNPMISGELNESQRWDVLYGITLDTDPQNRITIDRLKNALKLQLETCSKTQGQGETELGLYLRDLEKRRVSEKELGDRIQKIHLENPEIPMGFGSKTGKENGPFSGEGVVDWKSIRPLLERAAARPYVGEEDLQNHRSRIEVLNQEFEDLRMEILNLEKELAGLGEERDRKTQSLHTQREAIISEIKPMETRISTYRANLDRAREARDIVQKMCGAVVGSKSGNGGGLLEYVDQMKVSNFADFHRRVTRLFGTLIWLRVFLQTYSLRELQTPTDEIEKKICEYGFVEKAAELKGKIESLEHELRAAVGGRNDLKLIFEGRSFQKWSGYIPAETSITPQPNQVVYAITCPCCEKKIRTVFDKSGSKNPIAEPWKDDVSLPRGFMDRVREHDHLVQSWMDVPKVEKPEGTKERWMKLLPKAGAWGREPAAFQKVLLELLPLADKISESDFARFERLSTSLIDLDLYQTLDAEQPLETWEKEFREMRGALENLEDEFREIRKSYEDKISLLNLNRIPPMTVRKLEKEAEIREFRRRLEDMEQTRDLWREISSRGFPDRPIPRRGFVEEVKCLEETLIRREELQVEIGTLVQKIEVLKESLESTIRKQETILRLQMRLEQVESDVLAESIHKISGSANEFLENCFDNPMLVQLTTEKESRGGKTKKHSVNLSIKSGKKDGNLLERGLDGFSGGETDRISLGFSSAITGFSPFPMLLLDECISSLDSDMKDKTIRALRQQAKRLNKTIVLVCHDAVEGLFDHVCELE